MGTWRYCLERAKSKKQIGYPWSAAASSRNNMTARRHIKSADLTHFDHRHVALSAIIAQVVCGWNRTICERFAADEISVHSNAKFMARTYRQNFAQILMASAAIKWAAAAQTLDGFTRIFAYTTQLIIARCWKESAWLRCFLRKILWMINPLSSNLRIYEHVQGNYLFVAVNADTIT